ncbi:hypothetical protein ABZZ74_23365 [Streptomyces sp. NPDC006476]
MATTHTFAVTIEASGEVTPAQPPAEASEAEPVKAESEEAEQ